MQALIGTAKGLIVYDFSNPQPELAHIHFPGFDVSMVFVDDHTHRWWVGVNHKHWGQKLHFSDDGGVTWHETKLPAFQGAALPNGNPAKLRQIWCMNSSCHNDKHRLWMGTDPGGLFVSSDQGKTFDLVESLWNHPSRKTEGQWFGAGSDHPFIHSIVIDPGDQRHIYIAVSCAGVFESRDGGDSWQAKNTGLVAAYLPNHHVEVGHGPHIARKHPAQNNILWQQNHCGIYYSEDAGNNWQHVSHPKTIPYYGFALVTDETNASKAWVIPVESDEQRIAPGYKLRVYRTDDFGSSWSSDSQGLPDVQVFDIVLRQAFERAGEFMLFGTTNGNVYYRQNDQSDWLILNSNLTKVNSVFICK